MRATKDTGCYRLHHYYYYPFISFPLSFFFTTIMGPARYGMTTITNSDNEILLVAMNTTGRLYSIGAWELGSGGRPGWVGWKGDLLVVSFPIPLPFCLSFSCCLCSIFYFLSLFFLFFLVFQAWIGRGCTMGINTYRTVLEGTRYLQGNERKQWDGICDRIRLVSYFFRLLFLYVGYTSVFYITSSFFSSFDGCQLRLEAIAVEGWVLDYIPVDLFGI